MSSGLRLLIADAGNYKEAVKALVSSEGKKCEGILVCANRPHDHMRGLLAEAGVDANLIVCLDCISSATGMAPEGAANTYFIENPNQLEKIGLRVEQLMRRQPDTGRCVLFDSLTTLAVYSNEEAVVAFTHHLLNRLRLIEVHGTFLATRNQGPATLIEKLRPMFDEVVEL